MKVNTIRLINYRNFKDKEIIFDKNINLISAINGKGKTNILEAIRVMSYGKPLFFSKETDIINIETLNNDPIFTKIVMSWENQEKHISSYTLSPTIRPLKSISIDSKKKTLRNFVGNFSSVWFSPETINIITSSAKPRRDLLDAYFMQLSFEYTVALYDYNLALSSRNRILKTQDKYTLRKYIERYDDILIQKAITLIEAKKSLVEQLSDEVIKCSLYQNRYLIRWIFEPNVEANKIFKENYYLKLKELFKESLDKDIKTKRTNVGPHRDNWTLELNDKKDTLFYNLTNYGSRGQKRMGLLIFTLAIVSLLEKVKDSRPVLLLDDVVSELDDENIGLIIQMLKRQDQQSIITSTHSKIEYLDNVNIITL